jgi:ribosomal protein S8
MKITRIGFLCLSFYPNLIFLSPFSCSLFSLSWQSKQKPHAHRAILQENHNNSSAISQSSSNIAETQHQVTQSRSTIINQTLQTINNNNNNNNNTSTVQKSKIHSNVDQQLNDPSFKEDDEVLVEPNNNSSSTNTNNSKSRAVHRNHPVSRRGCSEFIAQQVPSFRSFGGANNRHITQRNK